MGQLCLRVFIELPIQLNGIQMAASLAQRQGEMALSRADLHHGVVMVYAAEIEYFLDQRPAGEEILGIAKMLTIVLVFLNVFLHGMPPSCRGIVAKSLNWDRKAIKKQDILQESCSKGATLQTSFACYKNTLRISREKVGQTVTVYRIAPDQQPGQAVLTLTLFICTQKEPICCESMKLLFIARSCGYVRNK